MANPELKLQPVSRPASTILVIEDNSSDQALLIRQLQKAGVANDVMCVEDGTRALDLVREGATKLTEVCAVFLDLSLPGVDGKLLLQAIRANVATAVLPVFVMTGSTDPKDKAECERFGATRFLPKQLLSLTSFRSTLAGMFPIPSVGMKVDQGAAK